MDTLNRFVRFGARILVFVIALVALVGALIVAVTQIPSFRIWALHKGLDALNGQLQARIEIGDVTGNFITGLTLHDVKMITDSTTLLESPTVDLQYQLRPFFSQQVVGAKVYIYNPVIRLIRNRYDSSWNYTHVTKPAVDSVKTPFNWKIDVAALEIQNGTVYMHDLTQEPSFDTVSRQVNYYYLDFNRVNLALQAHIEPTSQSVWIQHLSMDIPQPDVRLVELAANFTMDTTGLSVKNFRLETDRTNLGFSGHLDSVNFLGIQKAVTPFKEHPMAIDLDAERVSTLELKRFIPALAFLGGDPSLRLNASGTLGNLKVRTLHLGLDDDSWINVTGVLRNLDSTDALYLDTKITDTHLSDEDTRTFVPGLNLPDLRYLGQVTLRTATFVGAPEKFTATVDAATAVGQARGGIDLDLRGGVPVYTGDAALIHANLAPVVKDKSLASDFTGRAVINGRGFTLGDLDARVRLESQASTIAGRTYRKLYFDGAARNGGYVTIDTLLVDFGPKGDVNTAEYSIDTAAHPYSAPDLKTVFNDPLRLDGADLRVMASGPLLAASGWLDMRNPRLPHYSLRMRGRDFNLADLVPGSNTTRLTFTMNATGAGFRLDDLEGTGTINASRAEIPGKSIPPFSATYTLVRQDNRHRSLDLHSNFADVSIDGEWRPEAVIPAITQGFGAIADYFKRKSEFKPEETFMLNTAPFNEPIDAHYSVLLRDLSPVRLFVPGTELMATGSLSGDITGTPQSLSISSSGSILSLAYQADSTTLNMDSTYVDITLSSITPGRIGETMTADVSIRSDSAVRINDLSLRAPRGTFALQNGILTLHGAAAINNQVSVGVDGSVDITDPAGYRASIDTLVVGLPNGLEWRNVGRLVGTIGGDRVQIDSFAVQRRGAEIVSVTGALVGKRFENVRISAQQGSLRAIPQLIGSTDPFSTIAPLSGALRDLSVVVNGTLSSPEMTGTVVVDSLAYSGNPIGDLHANIGYRNKNLTGMVSVVNAPLAKNVTDSALIIDIASFPIDLALSGASDRIIKGGEVKITAHANDLSIAPAEPFLPGTRIRGGTADADFTVSGSFPDLVYSGGGRISNARILVEGNNILYLLPTAELQFKDDILSIKNAILRNDPRDYPRGAARVNGAITFSGFSITNLDISAETPGLLVLSDATQAVNDLVYGDLVIASDGSPIHFHGSLDAPRLDGDITVQQGDLVFPESKGRESNTNVVKYIDYDTWLDRASQPYGPEFLTDTLASRGDSIRTTPGDSAQSGSLLSQSRDIRKLIETVQGRQTGGTTSLTDKIRFDLNISIPGRLFVKMKLSEFEEVDAELATEGSPLHFVRGSDGKNHVTGTVSVLQGSRYNFFKTFDASGSLQFIEDLDNINLDLLATYSGRTFGTSGEIVHDYTVIVRISGTKRTPKVELDYTIDGKPPAVANQDERNRNAIALLLFGRTANELNSSTSGNSTLTGAAKSGFFAFTGSLSSNALNELVGGSRFVRSIGVDFGGSGGQGDNGQARLSVITQFGQVIVRYSGQINSPSNSLITVDLPASVLINRDWARHFVAQFELENQESGTSGTTLGDQSQEGRVRIQYRISW